DFLARYHTSPRSLRAFEQSQYPEDWRDLLRLFMVRRTRKYITEQYATWDAEQQRYFVLMNGERAYFQVREPKTVPFPLNAANPDDPYARLYHKQVVQVIEHLTLPRYGLQNYLVKDARRGATAAEKRVMDDLNRAGRRLLGFSRTNLFKRVESSGLA